LEAGKLLLDNGADVAKKTEGSTALHLALAVGSLPPHRAFALEAVRLLVERGADVNAKVRGGSIRHNASLGSQPLTSQTCVSLSFLSLLFLFLLS
jgi:ankyrin repeat protein